MPFGLKHALKKSFTVRFLAWLVVHNWVDLWAMFTAERSRNYRERKTVVFVKLDGIGDYVMWRPAFGWLDRIYPQGEWDRVLVANDKWEGLAVGDGFFDQVVAVNNDRFVLSPLYRLRTMCQIRTLWAEHVLNARLTRTFLWEDSIVRVSGAPVRIGNRGIDNLMIPVQEWISRDWYTLLTSPPEKGEHEIDAHRRFIAEFSGADEQLLEHAAIEPITKGNLEQKPFAIFFLGVSDPAKRWPIRNFAEVASTVADRHGLEIVLCGAPGEERVAAEFRGLFDGEVLDLVGRQTLAELSDLLTRGHLVVTNDTGAGHISSMAGVPTVVLTPGNHVGRFFPYSGAARALGVRQYSVIHEMPCFGCGWTCIYKLEPGEPRPCIANITVDDVLWVIGEALDERDGQLENVRY